MSIKQKNLFKISVSYLIYVAILTLFFYFIWIFVFGLLIILLDII